MIAGFQTDTLDVLLLFAVFMASVAALPTEAERKVMTRGDFAYAWIYRFLQHVCINVQAVSPSLGALSQRTETETHDAHGTTSRTATETTAVTAAIPNVSAREGQKEKPE